MREIIILYLLLISFASFGQEKLVNVNGNNYNYLVKGFENRKENAPVIIFENGMGVDLGNWKKILDQVSTFAPVFAYDRAGIGKTGKIFKMPTTKFVAESLHDILKTLKIAPPYILVGHSLGGVYTRSFAGFYPNEISAWFLLTPLISRRQKMTGTPFSEQWVFLKRKLTKCYKIVFTNNQKLTHYILGLQAKDRL
jgi:pimeloyl-ACP methyl ester carboxylesterase